MNVITNKYIGVLLGGCCGDILGSQTEGMTRQQIKDNFGDLVSIMPIRKLYTDDTEMTLVLARHLVNNKRVITDSLHQEFANEIDNKGYSQNTRYILTQIKNSTAPTFFQQAGNADTNGSVMRIAPLGLMNFDSATVVNEVKSAIFYTHGASADSHASAFLHCRLIRALVTNRFSTKEDIFNYMMGHARRHPPLWAKMNLVKYCLNANPPIKSITEELLGDENIFQIKAIDAISCAYYTFFLFFDNPVKAVCFAASMGGDTDTIAKIVGDLCGALHGIGWIPIEWHGVENESELIHLAVELSRLEN